MQVRFRYAKGDKPKWIGYLIPVGISVLSFLWGYRGNFWLKGPAPAPIHPSTQRSEASSPVATVQSPPKISAPTSSNSAASAGQPANQIKQNSPPAVVATEDNLETSGEVEDDAEEEDAPDEPELEAPDDENPENISPDDATEPELSEDDVDSGANEGDLEEDELETPPPEK